MKLFLRTALGLFGFIYCSVANAGDFYGSAGFQQNKIRISGSSFDLYGTTVRLGRWFKPGIGLEAAATIPLTDDRQSDVSIEMASLLSVGLRLESPMSRNQSTSSYVLGGFATTQITGVTSGAESTSKTYSGAFAGIGLLHSLKQNSHLTIDYVYYKVDQSIAIPSVHFGFRQFF